MWLPGHLAVGLLVCLLLLVLYVRRQGSLVLGLAFVAFFAVLLDFLHLGEELRAFSHSFFGAAVLLALLLFLLTLILGWRHWLALIAALAVGSHLLADLFIGHIYPWYPWSKEILQFNQFNTIFDIRVELGLCFLALIPFLILFTKWPRSFSSDALPSRDRLAVIILLGAFFIFASAQTAYFMFLDVAQNTTISALILSLVFIAATAASAMYLLRCLKGLRLDRKYSLEESIFHHY